MGAVKEEAESPKEEAAEPEEEVDAIDFSEYTLPVNSWNYTEPAKKPAANKDVKCEGCGGTSKDNKLFEVNGCALLIDGAVLHKEPITCLESYSEKGVSSPS